MFAPRGASTFQLGGGETTVETLMPGGDRGRKKMSQSLSQEMQFRPHARFLEPAASGDDLTVVSGKRAIHQPRAMEGKRAEARHNLPAQCRSGYDEAEIMFPWASKASVSWPGKAANARDYISEERLLEAECGKKVRVSSKAQQRNGINLRNPGDKIYAHVDYSPQFFNQEGVSLLDAWIPRGAESAPCVVAPIPAPSPLRRHSPSLAFGGGAASLPDHPWKQHH